jgi:hypothetical protein
VFREEKITVSIYIAIKIIASKSVKLARLARLVQMDKTLVSTAFTFT